MDEKRDRVLGCLLGGAVGDALGYPVEFLSEPEILRQYGPAGIQTLAQAGSPARVSDDTQMTLFAANAWIYGCSGEGWAGWVSPGCGFTATAASTPAGLRAIPA